MKKRYGLGKARNNTALPLCVCSTFDLQPRRSSPGADAGASRSGVLSSDVARPCLCLISRKVRPILGCIHRPRSDGPHARWVAIAALLVVPTIGALRSSQARGCRCV